MTVSNTVMNGFNLYKKIIPENEKVVWFENAVIRLNTANQCSWKKNITITSENANVSAKIFLEKYPNISFIISPTPLNQLGLSISMSMKLPQRFTILQMQDIIAITEEIQRVTESTCMQFKA